MNTFAPETSTATCAKATVEKNREDSKYQFPASIRLLNDPGFKAQLVEQLKSRLIHRPDSQKYHSLVDVYRRAGDIQLAADTAKTWAGFAPSDSRAAHISKLLNQQPLDKGPFKRSDIQPAPFAIIDNFLNAQEREVFWVKATNENAAYKHAGICEGNNIITDRSGRETDVLKLDKQEKNNIRKKIRVLFEPINSRFGLPSQEIRDIEVKLTAHREGGFFKIHQDGFQTHLENGARLLSWVYYFHAHPKPYRGGDLVLVDSTCDPHKHICNTQNYTRYAPIDNQIIFFPSWFYHGVTPVSLCQTSPDASRFAIAGHVRC